MSALACKVLKNKRPISGDFTGFRIVLAVLNTGGKDGAQSFHPRYRVAESGDHTNEVTAEALESWLSRRRIAGPTTTRIIHY